VKKYPNYKTRKTEFLLVLVCVCVCDGIRGNLSKDTEGARKFHSVLE